MKVEKKLEFIGHMAQGWIIKRDEMVYKKIDTHN
jgi:hypothetical protein